MAIQQETPNSAQPRPRQFTLPFALAAMTYFGINMGFVQAHLPWGLPLGMLNLSFVTLALLTARSGRFMIGVTAVGTAWATCAATLVMFYGFEVRLNSPWHAGTSGFALGLFFGGLLACMAEIVTNAVALRRVLAREAGVRELDNDRLQGRRRIAVACFSILWLVVLALIL